MVSIRATRRALVSSMLCSSILIWGCSTHYYQVNDPLTGKTYYTDDLKKIEGDGIELRDARTGGTVIIQNSEVKEINKYEFDSGRQASGKTGM